MAMRTTLNLDDDVVAQLADRSRRQGRSMSSLANALIRAGLRADNLRRKPERYVPPTFDTGKPLVDVTDVAAALEILDRGG
jgi:hypothetical protein